MSATNQPQRALGCVEFASLFQNPLLEEPPAHGAPTDVRRRYNQLAREAYHVCAACPLLDECLYRSVVKVDVAGYAAATTPQQRALIRARLKISVDPEDFDTLAGVTGRHRQVDHAEVVRLRRASPQDSLEDLARRLGCSLSTVKRHLRRERNNPSPPPTYRPAPTHEQVRAVAAEVTGRVAPGVRAA
jgi:DNA-binding CsgD family transcriptional regulator